MREDDYDAIDWMIVQQSIAPPTYAERHPFAFGLLARLNITRREQEDAMWSAHLTIRGWGWAR